jgi:hypothetical protein
MLPVCKLVYEGIRLRNNCASHFYYFYHHMFQWCDHFQVVHVYSTQMEIFTKLTTNLLLEHWCFFYATQDHEPA